MSNDYSNSLIASLQATVKTDLRLIKLLSQLVFLCLALIACSNLPNSSVYNKSEHNKPTASSQSIDAQIAYWLNKASTQTEPGASNSRIKGSKLLLQNQQKLRARAVFDAVDQSTLTGSGLWDYAVIEASFANLQGNADEVLRILDQNTLNQRYSTPSIQQQVDAGLLRAQAFTLSARALDSIEQRVFITPLLENKSLHAQNQEAIWQSIRSLPKAQLEELSSNTQAEEMRGWLILGLIHKLYSNDLFKIKDQLSIWQSEWPQHPANFPLPQDLQSLVTLNLKVPERISLLLPFSGRYKAVSSAIRDGFLAAHFDSGLGNSVNINIIDSSMYESFHEAFSVATSSNPDIIVGPLKKQELAALRPIASATNATILALNYDEDEAPSPFFQFGLAATDEAIQIANHLHSYSSNQVFEYDAIDDTLETNSLRALVIRPSGRWGDRVSAAFRGTWLQAGSRVLDEVVYSSTDNLSALLKQALLLDQSEKRKNRIAQLIGEKVEFVARRRKDIDMIFLAARPEQARSLKPILAFHYAGDVPVYSTSQIFSGKIQKHRDRDLNGITFTEIPWLLDNDNALRNAIKRHTSNQTMDRMVALGVDAYHLTARLGHLTNNENVEYAGVTGRLTISGDRKIHRQLDVAQIRNGAPKRLPPKVESTH